MEIQFFVGKHFFVCERRLGKALVQPKPTTTLDTFDTGIHLEKVDFSSKTYVAYECLYDSSIVCSYDWHWRTLTLIGCVLLCTSRIVKYSNQNLREILTCHQAGKSWKNNFSIWTNRRQSYNKLRTLPVTGGWMCWKVTPINIADSMQTCVCDDWCWCLAKPSFCSGLNSQDLEDAFVKYCPSSTLSVDPGRQVCFKRSSPFNISSWWWKKLVDHLCLYVYVYLICMYHIYNITYKWLHYYKNATKHIDTHNS